MMGFEIISFLKGFYPSPYFPGVSKRKAVLHQERRDLMARPLKIFGMGLIVSFLLFGVTQKGWTAEKYMVKPGDTLYEISKSFGVGIEALKKANVLVGNSIRPKQVLIIPSLRDKKLEKSARKPTSLHPKKLSAETIKRTSGEMDSYDSYAVKKGDSLYSISKKVGIPIEEIKKMNGLRTSGLKIGQILLLSEDEGMLEEEAKESGDGEKMAEASQTEGEKGEKEEPIASTPLGKWSNLEERGLLVKVAKTFLGAPYKLGGSTLKGIDCSAFVKKIYEIFNIQLPRTTREQFKIGKKVEKDQLEEGDLVFFKRRGNRAHVGIYVGDNQFIHASSYSREVKIDHLDTPYYSQRFLRGVRVKELERKS
jgi:peptidoglycan endopeptidase LytE